MTGGFAAVRLSLRTAEQTISNNRSGRSLFETVLRVFTLAPPLRYNVFADCGRAWWPCCNEHPLCSSQGTSRVPAAVGRYFGRATGPVGRVAGPGAVTSVALGRGTARRAHQPGTRRAGVPRPPHHPPPEDVSTPGAGFHVTSADPQPVRMSSTGGGLWVFRWWWPARTAGPRAHLPHAAAWSRPSSSSPCRADRRPAAPARPP